MLFALGYRPARNMIEASPLDRFLILLLLFSLGTIGEAAHDDHCSAYDRPRDSLKDYRVVKQF